MPISRDMAIFVLTTMMTTTMTIQPITLPLAHARGVIKQCNNAIKVATCSTFVCDC